ncbi:fumarylacetoacetate hydrolase family protein [bacterium]|nr:fumarylacetoacetate hydrolase family protein [bacterium]
MILLFSGVVSGENAIKRFARFEYQGSTFFGLVVNDIEIQKIEGDIFSDYRITEEIIRIKDVRILPPVTPSKIIAIGLNYRSHSGMTSTGEPGLFSKLPSSLAGQDDPIWIYADSENLHYEGEMVLVIGKEVRNISESKAEEVIFGVTAGNDVSERGWQLSDLQWIRAKGADSFSPVGPWIVTGLNYNDLKIQTRVNGFVRQNERTKNLIHSVGRIISYISHYFTLMPGDLIFTGTPGSTQAMKNGDIVEVEIEGVGILRNKVMKKPVQ